MSVLPLRHVGCFLIHSLTHGALHPVLPPLRHPGHGHAEDQVGDGQDRYPEQEGRGCDSMAKTDPQAARALRSPHECIYGMKCYDVLAASAESMWPPYLSQSSVLACTGRPLEGVTKARTTNRLRNT